MFPEPVDVFEDDLAQRRLVGLLLALQPYCRMYRQEVSMNRIRLDQDVKPLSEFRAQAASLVQRVRETKRPLVLTQRGHSAAVLLDVGEYDRLLDELELLREIRLAERQLEAGGGIPHEEARERVMAALKR